jgi:hypothetical protein
MKKATFFALCLFLILASPARSQEETKAVYKDPNAAIPNRVRALFEQNER